MTNEGATVEEESAPIRNIPSQTGENANYPEENATKSTMESNSTSSFTSAAADRDEFSVERTNAESSSGVDAH